MKTAASWLAGALWLCGAPAAGDVAFGQAIPGHSGLATFDLLKLLVRDLRPSGTSGEAVGHRAVAYQHIEKKGWTIKAPQAITLHSYDVETIEIPGDRSRIALLADLGRQEGFVADVELLALFSLTQEPKLLDVVQVGTAESTTFAQKTKPAMLAPETPLIAIDSEHDDADESQISTEMIFVRHGRFQFIGAFSTFDEKECGYKLIETPSYGILPGAGPYPTINVAVTARVTGSGEDCGEGQKKRRPLVATYRALYRWDGNMQHFVTRSNEMKRLAAFNQKYP